MKTLLGFFIAALLSMNVWAQTANYDAFRLSEKLIEQNWSTVQSILPLLMSGLKTQLESSGATKDAAKTLTEELQNNFTKESYGRGLSKELSERFTVEEMKQLSDYLASPVAKKFAEFSNSQEQQQKILNSIIKSTCESTKQKLGFFDRGSINSVCGKF
jgi:hypothetical protein